MNDSIGFLKLGLLAAACHGALCPAVHAEAPHPAGEVRKIAGDFKFTEGPAWHAEEGVLYFSDIPNRTLHCWSEKDGVKTIRTGKEASNGIYVDSEGSLVFCEVGGCRIVRRDAEGNEVTVAERVGKQPISHTNDLWVAPNGGVYFSVPSKQKIKRLVKEGRLMGTVLYKPPGDGAVRDVGAAIKIKSPNGVVGSSDGKRLYYTDAGKCWVAEIRADGGLENKRIAAPSGSDGLTLDVQGNLYKTAREKGVEIYDPNAKLIATIPVPEWPANLCFGGKDGRTLFITARTGVYAVEMNVRGDFRQ